MLLLALITISALPSFVVKSNQWNGSTTSPDRKKTLGIVHDFGLFYYVKRAFKTLGNIQTLLASHESSVPIVRGGM